MRAQYTRQANVVIDAYMGAIAELGFVVAPKNPDDAMLQAGEGQKDLKTAYVEMVAARPKVST
jgi:hypothetical protein